MASASSLLSEDQFLCPICLDVFTSPITTPCGHNFCKDCIHGYWHITSPCQCPMCKQKFSRRPELKVNTFIAEMADQFRRSVEIRATATSTQYQPQAAQPGEVPYPHHILATFKKHNLIEPVINIEDRVAQLGNMEDVMQQMIQGRLQKVKEIKHTVQSGKINAEREIRESLQVFTALVRSIQRSQAELIEVIEEKQKAAESRAEGLIKELEQEITELKRRSTGDHLHLIHSFPFLCTPPPAKDWSDIRVQSVVYVGTVRRAVRRAGSQFEETLKNEVKRLCETELTRTQQCAVDVTLDPDTAHPKLILSDNGKQVAHGNTALNLPDNPERFYPGISVLGREGFSSGRFYYEVQVKGKTEWDIGVGRESVNKKGGNTLNPEHGYWTVGLRNRTEYWALTTPPVPLPLVDKPQRVGVYVDWEGGQVSFYDVDSRSHIYSFTGYIFAERLYAYFNPRKNNGGVNSAPLVISPVSDVTSSP
ncbi:unnamed protein product [Oncorhynchus mykiss]|uniref:Uncharacterized protein n=1 Tax=Oncorhynchus mykiss TaxID=8022 RepID=A0A060WUU9_ONCMY|nr:unnamed protein product [Oncorhynchus mykiss]